MAFRTAARACALALLMIWPLAASADVAIPALAGRIVDQTSTLSPTDIAALSGAMKDLETRKGSQVALLIVLTTKPEEIEQFSIRVADVWKIGRKNVDDGILVIIAKDDHKMRIEVGRGLEGALPDITAKRIIAEDFTPKFKEGKYADGITAGMTRIIKVVDGEPLPPPAATSGSSPDDQTNAVLVVLAILAIGSAFVGMFMHTLLGRIFGSVATAGIAGLIFWAFSSTAAILLGAMFVSFFCALVGDFVLQAMLSGSGDGGGFSSSSSSSSDSGGFSGGGGGFSGGGASGDW